LVRYARERFLPRDNFGLNRSGLDGSYFIGFSATDPIAAFLNKSDQRGGSEFSGRLGLDFYLADELNGCTSDYTALKAIGTNVHAANRSVKTMMTINTTDSNLFNEGMGAVPSTIGCCWIPCNSGRSAVYRGGDLWSYTSCNAGFGNAPEWMVDYHRSTSAFRRGS